MSSEGTTSTLFFLPSQTFKLVKTSSFFAILIVSNFLSPQFNIFSDSLVLALFVLNPLATAVTLLYIILIEEAKEYCSTVKNPVFIPSTPIFLYNNEFLFPCVIGSPPVLSQVNEVSLKYE